LFLTIGNVSCRFFNLHLQPFRRNIQHRADFVQVGSLIFSIYF
jgi:hypothetical protein